MSFEIDGTMYEDFFEGGHHYIHRYYDHQVRRIPEERRMKALEDLVPSLFSAYNIVTEVTSEEVLMSVREAVRKADSKIRNTFRIDMVTADDLEAVRKLCQAMRDYTEYVNCIVEKEE